MKGRIYFPGLHALRFIAASLVIFHHIQQYKFWLDMPNNWGNPIIDAMGHKAVSFFFVLSGFLISYLLIAENKKTGKISIPNFYMRRVLRIWPLYFLIAAVAVWGLPFLMPEQLSRFTIAPYSTFTVIALFVFIPNVLRIVNPTVVGANQLWSVGIEEQFYLIWPLLIKAFVKSVLAFLYIFTALKFFGHILIFAISSTTDLTWVHQLLRLYELFPVEQMAIGAIGATYLFNDNQEKLSFIRLDAIFVLALIVTGILIFSGSRFIGLTYLEGMIFTIVILNVIHRKSIYQVLENKIFLHLGNISYGIYMYHSLMIFLVISFLQNFFLEYNTLFNIWIHVFSVGLTLVVSHFSYEYFEKPFLRMKHWLSFERMPGSFKRSKANI